MSEHSALVRSCPHFITGTYTCHATFLPDKDYAMVLDNVVKACCDILLVYKGKILLGKRNVFPQKSWWYGCGGRMMPGDTPLGSVRKLLNRELGISISEGSEGRIAVVGAYSYVWRLRQQEPVDHGTADISVVHSVTITEEEEKGMKIDRGEYDCCEWCDPAAVVDNDSYHPALRRSVADYLRLQMEESLFATIKAGGTDEQVAKVARNLAEYSIKISRSDRDGVQVKDTLEIAEEKEKTNKKQKTNA